MQSTLTKSQFKTFGPVIYKEDGAEYRITAKVRYDDQCNNGHNSFSITGEIKRKNDYGAWKDDSCGCVHEQIAQHFPNLAPFIKWHLFDSTGPIHYLANTIYHASNRDYTGLIKGEKQQITNGKSKLPAWHLVGISCKTGEEIEIFNLEKYKDAAEKPDCPYTIEYRPWCIIGEGKERNFDFARSCAVWPEATEEQLSLPADELKALLIVRLPALLVEFRAAVESLGFIF